MSTNQKDLEIFKKFNFKIPPVGIKYLAAKPEGLEKLDQILDFCEMLPEAQKGRAFYATVDNFTCIGPLVLGMIDSEPIFESGLVGPELEALKDPRANKRLYPQVPMIDKGTVNYVAFAPMDKLTFEPDVLVVTAETSQAEIILRAHSYSSGRSWTAQGTPVIGCAWMFVYPYLTGRMNLTVSGFGFGMRARNLFPEGKTILSIPWDLLPEITENLREMEWVPESYTLGSKGHKAKVRKIVERLNEKLSADK